MSDIILPLFEQGPAAVIFDGYTYYSQAGVSSVLRRESSNIQSDMHGQIDERHKSQRQEISFVPVGELEQMSKYFPYAVADIGKSIFGATNKPVVIHTYADGKTVTFPRAAITKLPSLHLGPNKTPFDTMTITAIGKRVTQQTDSAWWKTIASVAFSDTGFDDTKIITDVYNAALGARSTPYDAMGAIEGFKFDVNLGLKDVMDDGTGLHDIILQSMTGQVSFAPNNLTESQIDALLSLQNSGVMVPGQSYAKADEDLVITADAGVFTLYKAGPKDNSVEYQTGTPRPKEIVLVSKRTWTGGVPNELFDFSLT